MTDEEAVTRYLYFGLAILHMTKDQVLLTPIGELQDLIEVHNQMIGVSNPKEVFYVDDVIPQ